MTGRTMSGTLSRFGQGAGPITALGLVLLGSAYLMSNATQDSAWFGELYSALLAINAVALIGLGALIAWNLYRLLRQARERRPGAKLTVRMVVVFVVLSVTPVTVVYYFSLQFLHRGIDSWFDVRIEEALDDALELSRAALSVRMRELLAQTTRMAVDLEPFGDEQAARALDDNRGLGGASELTPGGGSGLIAGSGNADPSAVVPSHPGDTEMLQAALDDARRLSGASELTLIGGNGLIVGSSNADPTAVVPSRPSDTVMLQARGSGDYIGLDAIGDGALYVQVVVSIPSRVATGEPRLLQALFPVTERMNTLADSVESASATYRELSYLRKPLKLSFTLTLSIILLVGLFMAVYAAFHSARRMVAPLRDLSEGTKAVAGGNYETQLPGTTRDEIGFLVASFNEMTRELKRAQHETRRSQQLVEAQRAYLETVLRRLSTGVLTLDTGRRIVTANRAAAEILGVDLDAAVGTPLDALARAHPALESLVRTLAARLDETADDTPRDWREEVGVDTPRGSRVLVCSTASLAGGEGHVVVFDDVTALIQAQRNAAWSEVARRLAHEIKNPLTPIQLSAERLRHKYLPKVRGADAEQMDRLTRTIVQQVESLKEMVNAFSDYARTPVMHPASVDLNALVLDVVELYRTASPAVRFETRLGQPLAPVHADPNRLRQLLHNLVKNAVEACSDGGDPRVRVETRLDGAADGAMVELSVHDSGAGFPGGDVTRIFDPYVTSKPRGTGLGLAIVKKIVEEHGGAVSGGNAPEGGARLAVRLPAVAGSPEPAPRPVPAAMRPGA